MSALSSKSLWSFFFTAPLTNGILSLGLSVFFLYCYTRGEILVPFFSISMNGPHGEEGGKLLISLWPFSNLPPVTVRLFFLPRETNEITYVGRHSFTNIIGEVLCNTYVFSTFLFNGRETRIWKIPVRHIFFFRKNNG